LENPRGRLVNPAANANAIIITTALLDLWEILASQGKMERLVNRAHQENQVYLELPRLLLPPQRVDVESVHLDLQGNLVHLAHLDLPVIMVNLETKDHLVDPVTMHKVVHLEALEMLADQETLVDQVNLVVKVPLEEEVWQVYQAGLDNVDLMDHLVNLAILATGDVMGAPVLRVHQEPLATLDPLLNLVFLDHRDHQERMPNTARALVGTLKMQLVI